tara:strand:- start:13783 stop:14475 length:693 start_codon:yes stop_codon:yes gene_type:complete
MPLPNTFVPFVDGATVTANSVNEKVSDLEQFVNTDIQHQDLSQTEWVDPSIIVSPEFYGSPAPRVQLVSGDVHFRQEGGGTDAMFYTYNATQSFTPIPGLACTFHVAIPDGYTRKDVQVMIRASFFAQNSNSVIESNLARNSHLLQTRISEFALFVDDTKVPGTERYVYAACETSETMSNMNINMMSMVELDRGVHDVSIRIKPLIPSDFKAWQHTVIRHRTLNIEIHYL